jgi:hypothetical protein
MKTTCGLLAASALVLAACGTTTNTEATLPESAGSAGPGYCETVPTDPDDLQRWNELCAPGDQR